MVYTKENYNINTLKWTKDENRVLYVVKIPMH